MLEEVRNLTRVLLAHQKRMLGSAAVRIACSTDTRIEIASSPLLQFTIYRYYMLMCLLARFLFALFTSLLSYIAC